MREGRPHAKLLLHVAQIIVLVSLLQAVNSQTWYTGSVAVDYTDGLPEGAGMEVELEVDQETADGSVHIDGFLTFLQWQNSRNDTTIPSDSVEEEDQNFEFTPLSEIQEEAPLLIKVALSLGILLFGLAFFQIRFRAIVGLILNGVVIWLMVCLVILAPLGYVGGMDFGTGEKDDDTESTVHQQTDFSPKIDLINGEFDFEFTTGSYDLGLVDKSDLDEVIANPPGEEHESYVEMDGVAGIHYGAFVVELVWAWIVLFFTAPISIGFFNRVAIDKPQSILSEESSKAPTEESLESE